MRFSPLLGAKCCSPSAAAFCCSSVLYFCRATNGAIAPLHPAVLRLAKLGSGRLPKIA
ncbi:hypothetical protein PR003_g24494 [Phytophthora rubi]|uniref:Uncharacterized protein n=1 Tax=Phytophthora rubi TaxID=129364 RepID=A0A6A3KQ26_9STRA|nr:hypothetical protein PR002_g23680 [Phytophthora rubi]KAE9005624.1 hypothetical protein PR001_g17400 [Phytophthora rubi]KAE9293468.1 hypothetical protein PR003_g24494 [Phytophthora rubi]